MATATAAVNAADPATAGVPVPPVPIPNGKAAIAQRAAAGRLVIAGPLLLVFGRTALLVLAQALASGLFWLQGHPSPWQAAGAWWSVWASLADWGCLAALVWWTRREGLRLLDLFGIDRRRLGWDVLLGAGVLLVLFPLTMVPGTMLGTWLVFGTTVAPMYPGELTGRVLPLWAVVYSTFLWWPVWSATEELTFNGYALPRLEVLLRSRWLAVAVVGVAWAAMHAAVPLIPDARYVLWRTLSFLPLAVAMSLVYLRTRRLVPLVVAHWGMDVFGQFFTLAW